MSTPPFDEAEQATIARLLHMAHAVRSHFDGVAESVGLSHTQMAALLALEDAIPMGQLAEKLSCDRSNITGLIDRLEEQDLVTRQEDPADRRVKMLVLTPKGRKLRTRIEEQTCNDLPEAVGLTHTQLSKLGAILNGNPGER